MGKRRVSNPWPQSRPTQRHASPDIISLRISDWSKASQLASHRTNDTRNASTVCSALNRKPCDTLLQSGDPPLVGAGISRLISLRAPDRVLLELVGTDLCVPRLDLGSTLCPKMLWTGDFSFIHSCSDGVKRKRPRVQRQSVTARRRERIPCLQACHS